MLRMPKLTILDEGRLCMRASLMLTSLILASVVNAGTVYKSIGPDGKTIYSDHPPDTGKVDKTFNFAHLPSTPLPESVIRYRDALEKGLNARLSEAKKPASRKQPILFSAQWCGYCRQAKSYLNEKKIAYTEYDVDTEEGVRALVAAGGGQGVPILLWHEQKISGFSPQAYDRLFRNTP